MDDKTHDTAADIARLKQDLAKLKDDLGIQISETAKAVKAQGEEAVEAAQKKISERPLTSVLIARGVGVGLGMLIGSVMRRR